MTVNLSYTVAMKENKALMSIGELSSLVEMPARTIRYYIQKGMLNKPIGSGRGSSYTTGHVHRLLDIKKWQSQGLSLAQIIELLDKGEEPEQSPAKKAKRGISVQSHIHLDDGVTLMIDPHESGLDSDQVRQLATEVLALYDKLVSDKE